MHYARAVVSKIVQLVRNVVGYAVYARHFDAQTSGDDETVARATRLCILPIIIQIRVAK